MQVVLVMFRSDGERRSFSVVRNMTVIGRREDCDLRIPVGDVSRKHCRLVRTDDGIRIEDLGSSNGTYVNGERVQESELNAGDQVGVGPVQFIVQINGLPEDDHISAPTAVTGAPDPEDSNARLARPPMYSPPTYSPPIAEAPLEEVPFEEEPVEEVPAEEVALEEVPLEEIPLQAPGEHEAPVEEIALEEAPAGEASIEAPKAAEAPIESPTDELGAEEFPIEEIALNEPEGASAAPTPFARRPPMPMPVPPPILISEPEVMIEDEAELNMGKAPAAVEPGDSEIEPISLEDVAPVTGHESAAVSGEAPAEPTAQEGGDWDFIVEETEAAHGHDDFHIDLDSPHQQPHQ